MKGVRSVVFDLDGTLCDSAPDIAAALNATLAARGLKTFELATIKTMVGGGANVLVEGALIANGERPDGARVETMLADFLVRYRDAPCAATALFPGARDVLDMCLKSGRSLGICTNKPAELTGLVLSGLGIRKHFKSVVAASPAQPPKPAPDMLLSVLAELSVSASEAVMVGDSAADAGVARAAGVRCVLLRHGYTRVPLETLGAEHVIDGFAELGDLLS